MFDQKLVSRTEELIKKGEAVLRTATPDPGTLTRPGKVSDRTHLDYALWAEWRNQSLSFLQRTLGDTDNYSVQFAQRCDSRFVAPTNAGLGILRAVKQDLEGGHLTRLTELVRADLFSDFLEMAEYLLAAGFKDPAAVLGGGVLEVHLRLLCNKHGISTKVGTKPKKADAMNADLAKPGVYDTNQLKIITAWLSTRNSAAHAEYNKYTDGDVERFLAGIREFIARFPA